MKAGLFNSRGLFLQQSNTMTDHVHTHMGELSIGKREYWREQMHNECKGVIVGLVSPVTDAQLRHHHGVGIRRKYDTSHSFSPHNVTPLGQKRVYKLLREAKLKVGFTGFIATEHCADCMGQHQETQWMHLSVSGCTTCRTVAQTSSPI